MWGISEKICIGRGEWREDCVVIGDGLYEGEGFGGVGGEWIWWLKSIK